MLLYKSYIIYYKIYNILFLKYNTRATIVMKYNQRQPAEELIFKMLTKIHINMW